MSHSIINRCRYFLARWLFSTICGLRLGDWLRLLARHRFRISPRHLPRAAFVTLNAFNNSLIARLESLIHRRRIESIDLAPPLFILGHWRSGTTHLHELLSLDQRRSSPTFYEVSYPHTFLMTRRVNGLFFRPFLPPTRLIDRIPLGLDRPYEDEFALANGSLLSPYLFMAFPRDRALYDKYLTMRAATPDEIDRWKGTLEWFLRKVTLRAGKKPLILKSPPHTCRIRLLLELFPDARFVHLSRDPYRIFQSTVALWRTAVPTTQLQRMSGDGLVDDVIRQYREMLDAYLDERDLIPPGHLHELHFEDLERDPISELEKMYTHLDLEGFPDLRPPLEKYLASIADYKKGTYPDLDPELRERVAREWKRGFDEWGYLAD